MKKGDVVQLKSGGPPMTVQSLGAQGEVWCVWFLIDEYADLPEGPTPVYTPGVQVARFEVEALDLVKS